MVMRTLTPVFAAALLAALSGCSVGGETCGLGRCQDGSTCTTLFNGAYTSKAASPGNDIDHNYWCLGTCPGGKSCTGSTPTQCMEDPADDTVDVCTTNIITMKLSCPTTLGVTLNGSCISAPIMSCAVGLSGQFSCGAGQTCSVGPFLASTRIGDVQVATSTMGTLTIPLSSLAHTQMDDAPLLETLPAGITPQINVPSSCSN